jgi:hypothetical protein
MTIFLVSFNLARNQTYLDRFDSLMAELQSGPWWAESGTVVIVDAPGTIDEFCDRLFQPWSFDEAADVAVVFDLVRAEGRSKGRLRDYNLFGIVPWMKRHDAQ